jgi:hypothetical protein
VNDLRRLRLRNMLFGDIGDWFIDAIDGTWIDLDGHNNVTIAEREIMKGL